MKKFFIIAVMSLMSMGAFAQLEPGTFSIQPKVGSTISWLSNMPSISSKYVEIDSSPTVGFLIGAEAEYQLAEKFSLAAGLNYAQQGSGWDDYTLSYTLDSQKNEFELKDAKVQLDYLNVPLVANYYLFKGFAVKAGVQFGFLLSAKQKGTMKVKVGDFTTTSYLEDHSDNFKDECSSVDISIPLGISYQFNIPIVVDVRYNLGLTKVNKESVSGQKDMKNNVIQLTLGYKFSL